MTEDQMIRNELSKDGQNTFVMFAGTIKNEV